MRTVRIEDTRGKLRTLIQELPNISDNAVCFHDKDGNPVAFLLSPHGLAQMLTDAVCPEPNEEEEKLLRQMSEAANEEWQKLMQPQPDSIDAEIDRFLQDPVIRGALDSPEWKEAVSRVTGGTKEQKKAKS